MKWLFIALIRIYQRAISPLLWPMCRFHPTCSVYFVEALQKKGLFKGTAMGVWRILRCHPFCDGGYDPVEKATEDETVEIASNSLETKNV